MEAARADLETVLKLRPGHKAAVKELAVLEDLSGRLRQLQAQAGAGAGGGGTVVVGGADAIRPQLDAVYAAAPDCVAAQLVEARADAAARNFEQVWAGGSSSPAGLLQLVQQSCSTLYGASCRSL